MSKAMRVNPTVLSIVAIAISVLVLGRMTWETAQWRQYLRTDSEAPAGELAYHMAYLQRYVDKLGAATSVDNTPLASFYLHELEETAATIVSEGHVEDGHEISALVATHLLPAIEQAETQLAQSSFERVTGTVIAACNACHVASDHAFIRIQESDVTAFPNQDFRPIVAPKP